MHVLILVAVGGGSCLRLRGAKFCGLRIYLRSFKVSHRKSDGKTDGNTRNEAHVLSAVSWRSAPQIDLQGALHRLRAHWNEARWRITQRHLCEVADWAQGEGGSPLSKVP